MRFSETFGIKRSGSDDWFDPHVDFDTRLFVDAFRIYKDTTPAWSSAHEELIAFFNLVLKLVARSGFNSNSAHWKAAERLLLFPEPSEFCLGYGAQTVHGSGSGRGLQIGMLDGATTAIEKGIIRVEHFEELTLFQDSIGADRISDMVCNVLKSRFITYTQRIMKKHGIVGADVVIPHAKWSLRDVKWEDDRVRLPTHPKTSRPVLLVPQRFLRSLPSVDPSEFWDYAWTNENKTLRGEFNYDIGRHVDGADIARLARRHPEIVQSYVRHLETKTNMPYDFAADPASVDSWDRVGRELAMDTEPPPAPSKQSEVPKFVLGLTKSFQQSVEQRGWKLLWVGDRPRREEFVQATFAIVAKEHCVVRNVDMSPESNAGRGPVDFKFSRGWKSRCLLEVKPTNNTRFWKGLINQLPAYMTAEEVHYGVFMAIGYRDKDFERERLRLVDTAAAGVERQLGIAVKVVTIDARRKDSASKL